MHGWPRRAARSGRRTCCGRRPGSPITPSSLGLELAPGGGAAPVGDRAVRALRARTFRACHAARCAPTCGSSRAGWCRSWPRRMCRCRGSGPRRPTVLAEIDGYLALAGAQPTAGAADAGGRAGLPGRRRRADPRRPARRARHRRRSAAPAGSWSPCAAPGPGRCRCWPATTTGCWPRRRSPGPGWSAAGPIPDGRNITTPLTRSLSGGGGLPRLDTSRLRATWLADVAELLGPGHVHGTPPGSPAPSGSATCSPACNPPPRPTRSGCSGAARRL